MEIERDGMGLVIKKLPCPFTLLTKITIKMRRAEIFVMGFLKRGERNFWEFSRFFFFFFFLNFLVFFYFFSQKLLFTKRGRGVFLGKYKKWEAMWWCFGTPSHSLPLFIPKLAILSLSQFLVRSLYDCLEALPSSILFKLFIPGKLWMSSFHRF